MGVGCLRPLSKEFPPRQTSHCSGCYLVLSGVTNLCDTKLHVPSKTPHPSELSQTEEISPGLLKRSKREALLMIPPGMRETQRHIFYQRLYEPLVSWLKACHYTVEQRPINHRHRGCATDQRRNPFGLSLRNVRLEAFYRNAILQVKPQTLITNYQGQYRDRALHIRPIGQNSAWCFSPVRPAFPTRHARRKSTSPNVAQGRGLRTPLRGKYQQNLMP